MKRMWLSLTLLAVAAHAYASDGWSGLWRNADQRGDALMQDGKAKAAVDVYADPYRKAYAELQAQNYAAAEHDFSVLKSNDARYNQGNALAHLGKLQEALNAYDAVLKNDPKNADARHNRDLVAEALKQKKSQQQKSGDKSDDKSGNESNDKSGDKAGDNKSKEGQQQNQGNAANKNGNSGKDKQGGDQAKNSPSNNSDAKNDTGKSQSDQSKANSTQAQQNKSGAGDQNKGNASTQSQPQSQPQSQQAAQGQDSADQARRDAMASQSVNAQSANNGKPGASTDMPKTEQQIAEDQWLRAIPDDPGGLLKRKFLIEQMMRQQKEQP